MFATLLFRQIYLNCIYVHPISIYVALLTSLLYKDQFLRIILHFEFVVISIKFFTSQLRKWRFWIMSISDKLYGLNNLCVVYLKQYFPSVLCMYECSKNTEFTV